MFNLFNPTLFSSKAPRWAAKVPAYPRIFGFSPFADLFLSSSDGTKFALLRTEHPELIELNFSSKEQFIDELLTSTDMLQSVFRINDYESLVGTLGPLTEENCYYPVPYPAIGGSGKLDTFESGNVWVYLDIYAQAIGV